MDNKTIFVLTAKGEEEVSQRTSLLYGDIKRALSMMDGTSTFAEISKRAAPSLRSIFAELSKELLANGFIEEKSKSQAGFGVKIVEPPNLVAQRKAKQEQSGGELDFTSLMQVPSPEVLRAEAEKFEALKKGAAQQPKPTSESAKKSVENATANVRQAEENMRRAQEYDKRLAAMQEAQALEEANANELAEQEANMAAEAEAKVRVASKLKTDAEAKAKEEAEALRMKMARDAQLAKEEAENRARAQAEFARLKAEQEVEVARKEAGLAKKKAEAEAKARDFAERRAKIEAEAARVKAEQEVARKQAELEASRLKAEAEARARAAADEKIKQAEEAARLHAESVVAKAKEEAERVRLQAEQEAAQVKAESERIKREAEMKARADAEEKIKQAEEAARLHAELVASQARVEAERIKREAEAQAKIAEDTAHKAKQEADAARLQVEHDAARVREELEIAKQKIEQENKARMEADAARFAAERAAEQARTLTAQVLIQEREIAQQILEQQAAKAREEEQIRAKQLALAAASTHVRETPVETTSAIKLDSIDPSVFAVKPTVQESVAQLALPLPGTVQEPVLTSVNKPTELSAEQFKVKELSLIEQAKLSEEERMDEHEAAKKLADAQAKAWIEAEQRAIDVAKAHAEYLSQQQTAQNAQKQQGDKKLRAVRARRKPLPWGRLLVGMLVLLVLAIFLVPMVIPTQEYAARLEKTLSDKLQQPVHVGKLSGRILPTPRLDLEEVYIGEVKQIKAQQARLDFDFSALFSQIKKINRIELTGAEFNGNGLLDVPAWLQKLSSDAKYPIQRVEFNLAKLNGDAIQLSDLDGVVNLTSTGQIHDAVLRADAGKLTLNIQSSGDKLEAVFKLHDDALPLFPNWHFQDLNANGELNNEGFVINDFDGLIAGGSLQGEARIDWSSGWNVQGSMDAKSVNLASLNRLMEGSMDGDATFKMHFDTLGKLSDSTVLEGDIVAKKGILNGVDIVEIARSRSKVNLPGGRTHFDELNSKLTYNNNVYHFRSLKIVNNVLNATGNIDVSQQQLSGRVSARLSIQEGVGASDLQVGGVISNPSLHSLR